MLTLQSILKLHSVKNGSAPYAKPVKVVVCGVSECTTTGMIENQTTKCGLWIRGCSTMRNICRNALLVTAFLSAMR